MFLLFGLLLIFTAIQLFRHRDEDPDVEDNVRGQGARRLLPVTDDYVDGKLFTRVDGRRMATPLFLVLIAIGSTDLLFALDSIPAVFGVTEEPYIVFAANAFALLGLRALFFLVKGLLDRLVYLSTGLSIILAFIGVKLVLHWAHVDINPAVPEIPTPSRLGVIVGRAGDHHGGQPGQDPERPDRQGARGVDPGAQAEARRKVRHPALTPGRPGAAPSRRLLHPPAGRAPAVAGAPRQRLPL